MTPSGVDLRDRHAEPQLDAAALQLLGRVGVGLVGEGAAARVCPRSTRITFARGDGELRIDVRHHVVDELGERARGLHPGRPAADDDEGQRAVVDEFRVVGRLAWNSSSSRGRMRCASSRL